MKCSLSRLKPSVELRKRIDVAVKATHELAIRGSLVATQAALDQLEHGTVPQIDQSFWYRAFCYCGKLSDGGSQVRSDKQKEKTTATDTSANALSLAAERLLSSSSPIFMDKLWSVLASLSRDMMTVTQNMLAAVFHSQLKKVVAREITLYDWGQANKHDKEQRFGVIQYYAQIMSGWSLPYLRAKPAGLAAELEERLNQIASDWTSRYAELLPCPSDTYIYNWKGKDASKKISLMVAWIYETQQHRMNCLQALQTKIPVEDPTEARSVFGKDAKPVAVLPMCSFSVKHIAVDLTTFKILSVNKDATNSDFLNAFPGAKRLKSSGWVFDSFLRTDGISAEIIFKKKDVAPKTASSKKRKNATTFLPAPLPNQRLIAIDPGRRDMIVAVSNDETEKPIIVSTRSVHHDTGTRKAARITRHTLRRCSINKNDTLEDVLSRLPPRRDLWEWNSYVSAVVPILEQITKTYQVRILRRTKFASYVRRDVTLDRICKSLTRGERDVLVAFGAASSCSTGFGHAPAPQSRLRFRLEKIHGAKISLVDEYRTSQCCSRCHTQLEEVYSTHYDQLGVGRSEKVWGVRHCRHCKNDKNAPLYVHRDVNAAKNIMSCYLSEAQSGQRPSAFSRNGVSTTRSKKPRS